MHGLGKDAGFSASDGCSNGGFSEEAALKHFQALRETMVAQQVIGRGITDTRVLNALRKVPRHEFVPDQQRCHAYEDRALPIGFGQTISQPYIVAFMTQAAALPPHARVLEIGTGSGYQSAILGELGAEVYTLEIIPELAACARDRLQKLGYNRIHVLVTDAFDGLPAEGPYDAVLAAAAPKTLPPSLLEQLKIGGRLIMPLGVGEQQLVQVMRTPTGFSQTEMLHVRFVPMTGKAERPFESDTS